MPPLATWPVGATEFRLLGTPKPLQRPRFNQAQGHVYNPSGADLQRLRKRAGAAAAGPPPPACAPVAVELEFVMPRPRAHFGAAGRLRPSAPRQHLRKPDVDNLAKLVLDALPGTHLHDDAQVHRLVASKRYCDCQPGHCEAPHTRVRLEFGLPGAPEATVAPETPGSH